MKRIGAIIFLVLWALTSVVFGAEIASTLFAKAQQEGAVPVIIGLDQEFTPIGDLPIGTTADSLQVAVVSGQRAVLASLAKLSPQGVKQFRYIPAMALIANEAILEALRQDPKVKYVREDQPMELSLYESAPLINADLAWASGYAGSGQAVAIIDSGVDKFHPFLEGKVISEACYSTNIPASGIYSLCPGGVTSSTAPDSGLNCSSTVSDSCSHGTHVAGIAAGSYPDSNFFGISPSANIIAIQVGSWVGVGAIGMYDSDVTRGLERVLTLHNGGIDIASVNLSLGSGEYTGPCDSALLDFKQAVDNLRSVGIATIVSSGNEGYSDALTAPACVSTAISAGSVWDTSGYGNDCAGNLGGSSQPDEVACYSNSASFLNLLAPGSAVQSSVPGGSFEISHGTSMAAPHVAGAWAVLKQAKPNASVNELLGYFTSTGVPVTDWRNGITKPRIDVNAALEALRETQVDMVVSIEEPVNGAPKAGVGNVRGWAVGSVGINRVEFYIDGVFVMNIPYGGARGDVGSAFPGFPNSSESGFGMTYNFALLAPGSHTFRVRAVDNSDNFEDAVSTFQVRKFHTPYISTPSPIDLSTSTLIKSGSAIVIDNVRVDGVLYDLRLEWVRPSQDFNIIGIQSQ